jgi:DNA-binding response OmpR family regulator
MYVCVYPPTPTPALTAGLLENGYRPVPIDDVDEVVARAPEDGWAAAVVEALDDVGRALAVCDKIASEHNLPVLLVVDRTMTATVAEASGYRDFVLSPLDRTELGVRLGRILLGTGVSAIEEVLRFRDLELNTATYQATVGGEPRDLTYMEYELLRFFVENPGRVWSREQLLSRVWGYDYFGGSRTVDVHVRRLRAKLGEERSSWITTVRSVGYRFG